MVITFVYIVFAVNEYISGDIPRIIIAIAGFTYFFQCVGVIQIITTGKNTYRNATIIGTLSIGVGDSVTISGTNVVFDIDISDLEASNTDLPASTTSSNAETDTRHGISFKIAYLQGRSIEKTASISVSSVLTYRLFFSNKRTVSLKTGAATVSHTINLN